MNVLREAKIRISNTESKLVVHSHNALFPQNASDPEWIQKVGEEGWIGISKDFNIKRRELERRSVQTHGAALFIIKTRVRLKADQMAELVVKAFPRIVQFLNKNSPPFIAKITKEANVEMELDLT